MIEEVLNRSHRNHPVDITLPLEKKTHDPKTLARLLEIENALIKRAQERGLI